MRDAQLSPSANSEGSVVTKAVLRSAGLLAISNKQLASIIGLSEATISRMGSGSYVLKPGDKAFELSLLFLRLYRSLDAIVGGDDDVASQWVKNRNSALNGVPLELMQTVAGLFNVLSYLDARRAAL